MFTASNIHYEMAERTRAVSHGGIGAMHCSSKRSVWPRPSTGPSLFKFHLPYHESDHVLNIAYNVLCEGTCLEHIELRRNDEAYLDALGARRIPDPTTAGDFCRRFREGDIFLAAGIPRRAPEGLGQQPAAFFDGRSSTWTAQWSTPRRCKQGMDITYKGNGDTIRCWCRWPTPAKCCAWSIAPAIGPATRARPRRSIWLALVPSGRLPAHLLRGDTDFSQTERLDGWDEPGDSSSSASTRCRTQRIGGKTAGKRLEALAAAAAEGPRQAAQRPENVKEQIVEERSYKNIRLKTEDVAEFDYRPAECKKTYRMVVVWKELEESDGQGHLFDKSRCFFYITNDRKLRPNKSCSAPTTAATRRT